MLAELERESWGAAVQFLDGGTQGLALLAHICGRRALLVLDAVKLGAAPGTVHALRGWNGAVPHAATAHESNAGELLGILTLLGELPEHVRIIGIEPERVATSVSLSDVVRNALGEALEATRVAVREMIGSIAKCNEESGRPTCVPEMASRGPGGAGAGSEGGAFRRPTSRRPR